MTKFSLLGATKTMLLRKLNTIRLFEITPLAAYIFLVSFQLVGVSVSYAQDSHSRNALPSVISLLLNDDSEPSCSNPSVPDYQIGMIFPDSISIIVPSGSLEGLVLPDSPEITGTQKLAFIKAACFWQNVIIEDISDSPFGTEFCGRQVLGGASLSIDDLLIFIDIGPVDGPGDVMFQSGPCYINGGFVKAGIMTFDSVDIDLLESSGTLDAVVRHEMGHVLGIGTMWSFLGLIQDALPGSEPNLSLDQPKFVGPNAVAEYNALGGTGNFVPVENGFTNGISNDAGPEAINGHLAQTALGTEELMTFKVESVNPPLSRVTIGSLKDLGYTVDYSQADSFSLPLP